MVEERPTGTRADDGLSVEHWPDGAGTSSREPDDGRRQQRFVWRMASTIALGGLLFGYDTGVISGALLFIGPDLGLGDGGKQVVVASLLLGAIVGALAAGWLTDRLGRRLTLVGTAAVFTAGAVASALAPGFASLVAVRFVLGVAIGTSSLVVPTYLAELSPKDVRGRLVSMNQMLITVGIFVSYLVGYALSSAENWRLMLGLAAVPSLLMLVGLLALPESPRWLVANGREDDARAVLERTRRRDLVDDELAEIVEQNRVESQTSYRALLRPELRPALRLGIGVAVVNQLIGVNAVIYYAPTLLQQAGFGDSAAILAQVGIGAVNMVVTLAALLLVDRLGRRPLLLTGIAVSTLSLLAIGGLYLLPDLDGVAGYLLVGALGLYIAAFAASLGIAIWLVNSEVYPNAVRGKASSLGTFAHWGLDFLISLTVLTLISTISETGTFWMFAVFGALGFVFLLRQLPETKGRSLEEIDADLRRRATR